MVPCQEMFCFVFVNVFLFSLCARDQDIKDHSFRWTTVWGHDESQIAASTLIPKLQAPVYDILPSATAIFSYAVGSRKLSANKQLFCSCSNSSKFVTNNSNYIRRLFYNWPCCLCQLRFTGMLGHWVASTVILVPKPFWGHWPCQRTAAWR